MRSALLLPAALIVLVGCATTPTQKPADAEEQHGVISDKSRVEGTPELCSHKVPEKVCVRHHPELVAEFKKVGDWCGEHDVPESQCLLCHPDLTFTALPTLREGADLDWLSRQGEDVASLESQVVPGKVTVFDFYADWCAPCRTIDAHVYELLNKRDDLAVRKLNVVNWETPLAKRHLADVPNLPYVVVFGRDGQKVKAVSGLDLAALDQAIEEGAAR